MNNINTKQNNGNLKLRSFKFDKYCIWNLVYSITIVLMLVLLIVYYTAYDSKLTFLQFGTIWYWTFFGATIMFSFVFLIINICFSISRLIKSIKTQKLKDIIFYSIGMIIPFVGFSFQFINHNNIIKDSKINKNEKTKNVVVKNSLIYISGVIGGLILLFPSFLLGSIFAVYKPPVTISLKIDDDRLESIKLEHNLLKTSNTEEKISYSALSYNIGYNAYNQDMHFFMDMKIESKNSQSRAQSKDAVLKSDAGVARILNANHDLSYKTNNHDLTIQAKNLRGAAAYKSYFDENGIFLQDVEVQDNQQAITQFNNSLNSDGTGTFDFICFQEQDRNSTRSYYVDTYKRMRKNGYSEYVGDINPELNDDDNFANHYSSVFGYNFSVPWVPKPLHQMYGQVLSGLSIFSKYTMKHNAQRITIPNIDTFPLNTFELKRCLIITRYPVNNGKEFVFINVHFSAYDKTGQVRLQQLGFVNQIFKEEINKGNYVLLGADWNQVLPQTYGYNGSDIKFNGKIIYDENDPAIAPLSFKDFKWGKVDPAKPTTNASYASYADYDSSKSYKIGDVVYFESENDPTSEHVCLTYIDGSHPHKHLYSPLIDNPTEEPLIFNQSKHAWEKSTQWRYYDDSYYWDASLSKRVLNELLPVAGTENNQAKFFTTHAIPTVRDAGYNFRVDDENGYVNQYTTTIDGFLVSNNIGVNFTFGFDTEFIYSDHNPIGVSFYLKG